MPIIDPYPGTTDPIYRGPQPRGEGMDRDRADTTNDKSTTQEGTR